MALCDYRPCDVCGGKAFYDANLNYDSDGGLDNLGDWVVICKSCAKTHKCLVALKTLEPMIDAAQSAEMERR